MDARRRFGELMNRVSLRGERYVIERAGKPIAELVPVEKTKAATGIANTGDPFENPFATFTEWNDPSNDVYDTLVTEEEERRYLERRASELS